MRKLLTVIAILCPLLAGAQAPILRNPVTTNQFMNLPQDGWIAVWNSIALKWSNTINVASSTNLPAYLQTATLTNLAGTGLSSGATNASGYIGSSSGLGTNTEIRTRLTVNGVTEITNGKVVIGDINAPNVTTNYNATYQRAQLTLNDPGNSLDVRDGAFIEVNAGGAIILGADGVGVNRIQFTDGDYITSPLGGTSDNNEIFRYRLWGDTSASAITNRVQRWWEMSNYVASAAVGGGGGPGTLPMNTTQFDTNTPVSLISGFRGTNANLLNSTNRGAVHYSSGLASNSFLYLNASSNVAAGTFGSGLTFSGGTLTGLAGSTNNPVQAIGTQILTNGTIYKPLDLGHNTNIVLSWNTNYYVASPSNTFTISWSDVPSVTDGRQIFLKLINTNSASGFFPTNGLNGGPVIMLSAPSTNEYTFNYDTNGFWIRSGQILATGTGDTNVFNVQPVVHSPTLKGTNTVDGNVGFVEQYPTGSGGANTNFTLLVNSAASFVINGFTNVSFRALYGGTLGITYTFSIEVTNGSGSNRTLEFNEVTNAWRWSYAQGGIAPTVLTNSEKIVIEGKLRGTNITAAYAYYPWP